MVRLKASEMREISQPKLDQNIVERHLDNLFDMITVAATDGEQSVIIRAEPYCKWLYLDRYSDVNTKECLEVLKEYGYTVKQHYHEKQFVDLGLSISW